MEMKKSNKIILTTIGIVIAVYTLFPFYLVVMNTFKAANSIVASPVGFEGVSVPQLMTNLSSVVNNSNFNFWYAFGTSVIITILSLILLALFGGMAAWVICRNKTKWSTAIYLVFIASMIIPFQVVMLPLISTFRDVGSFVGLSLLQSIPGIVFAYCQIYTTTIAINADWVFARTEFWFPCGVFPPEPDRRHRAGLHLAVRV